MSIKKLLLGVLAVSTLSASIALASGEPPQAAQERVASILERHEVSAPIPWLKVRETP